MLGTLCFCQGGCLYRVIYCSRLELDLDVWNHQKKALGWRAMTQLCNLVSQRGVSLTSGLGEWSGQRIFWPK